MIYHFLRLFLVFGLLLVQYQMAFFDSRFVLSLVCGFLAAVTPLPARIDALI